MHSDSVGWTVKIEIERHSIPAILREESGLDAGSGAIEEACFNPLTLQGKSAMTECC